MTTPFERPRDPARRSGSDGIVDPPPSSPPVSELQMPPEVRIQGLIAQGIRDAEGWRYVDGGKSGAAFLSRCRRIRRRIRIVSRNLSERKARGDTLSAGESWLLENARLLQTLSQEVFDAAKSGRGLTVRGDGDTLVPRAFAAAVGYLRAVDMVPTEATLSHYFEGIQQVESLMMAELCALKPMLEFAILEQIADYGEAVCGRGGIGGRAETPSRRSKCRANTESGPGSPRHSGNGLEVLLRAKQRG